MHQIKGTRLPKHLFEQYNMMRVLIYALLVQAQ